MRWQGIIILFCAALTQAASVSLVTFESKTGLHLESFTDSALSVTDKTHCLTFYYGTHRADFDGMRIWLNESVSADKSAQFTFYPGDVDKLILPYLTGATQTNEIKTIFIDAGHGGEDGGCYSPENDIAEKELTLDIAMRIGELLKAETSLNVIYSRTNDVALTLKERTDSALRSKAHIFLSIHVNSASKTDARGIETFLLPLTGILPTSGASSISTAWCRGNKFDSQNSLLALSIHRQLCDTVAIQDRGIKRARFQVLRDAPAPAVLVEIGFVSNEQSSNNLASNWYRDRIAEAIAKGVKNYITNVKIVPPPPPKEDPPSPPPPKEDPPPPPPPKADPSQPPPPSPLIQPTPEKEEKDA